jgi:hypothetical protein
MGMPVKTLWTAAALDVLIISARTASPWKAAAVTKTTSAALPLNAKMEGVNGDVDFLVKSAGMLKTKSAARASFVWITNATHARMKRMIALASHAAQAWPVMPMKSARVLRETMNAPAKPQA